ncbi:mitochondrial metal transporter [Gnomoniopsis smithogilvyi]|uniref:Mitochondrial metal transporter n=1 Tax=Gnomoniopsis smithogilvyi TaxID=1191159 RepID=A0A9W8Z2H2_9PEZI|nr:mitochondrial metal transporter [Gnomoniopsis smithogilvyi]
MSQQTLLDVEESTAFTKRTADTEAAPSEAQKAAHYGLLVNISMVFIKAIGGYLFSSESLLADAFHSATDILADLVTLVTVLLSRGDTKRERMIEGLGSLCVSGFIFTGGAAIAMHGLAGMRPYLGGKLEWLDLLESEGDSVLDDVPNVLAAWVALASILAKEWVYRITMKIAIKENSAVLRSNAIHHRIDCLSSVVALVTIIGVYLFPTSGWLDPVGAVVISVMVVQAGVESLKGAISEFLPQKGEKED